MDDRLNFTERAWDIFYDLADDSRFQTQDAELIYESLKNCRVLVSFGEYLQRYLHEKAELSGAENEIPLDEYRRIICDAFAENLTPPAFRETQNELSALAKNWLTRRTVMRETALLLGFGLRMKTEDVNEFLNKALGERALNPKNPVEVICWYCYEHGYRFPKYRSLYAEFEKLPPSTLSAGSDDPELTISRRKTMYGISDEKSLMEYLAELKCEDGSAKFSVSCRKYFQRLLQQTKGLIADAFNEEEKRKTEALIQERMDSMSRNPRLSDMEKRHRVEKLRQQQRRFTKDEITVSDIQHVFCAAIPVSGRGNLVSEKSSHLREQFEGKRFSRQHLSDLLTSKAEVSRYDLITLNFFIYSQFAITRKEYADPKIRFIKFTDSTNDILNKCMFGGLYMQNPYEMFCMMCMLTSYPLGTYSDVLELSYAKGIDVGMNLT